MRRPLPWSPALLLIASGGCVVVSHDSGSSFTTTETVVVYETVNQAPYVLEADAFVYYDEVYADDVWAFEATVGDPDGVGDVIGVWADVYDDDAGGVLVESFALYATADPAVWASEWLGSTSALDPFWPGYSVDFVVYDTYEDFGWLTVPATTY